MAKNQPPKKQPSLKQLGDSIAKYKSNRNAHEKNARRASEAGANRVASDERRKARVADSRAGKFYNDSVKAARKKP